MCLDSGARRRRGALPMLHLYDSSEGASDTECARSMPPARTCHPEIFTFDVESVHTPPARLARRGTLGPRSRRPRRVLYPPKVRKYLPPPETDRPLRWFYLLCLLVFVQICCEDVVPDDLLLPPSAVLVKKDLQPFPLFLHPDPAVPFTNHSQGAQILDATFSWVYHQR